MYVSRIIQKTVYWIAHFVGNTVLCFFLFSLGGLVEQEEIEWIKVLALSCTMMEKVLLIHKCGIHFT